MQSVVMGLFAVMTLMSVSDDAPRSQYEALVKEYDTAFKSFAEASSKAADDQERIQASLLRPQPNDFAPRFFAVAEKHPDDPVALDALRWIVSKCIFGPHAERALAMIGRDHGRSETLKDFCGKCSRYGEPFPPYEEMLRAVMEVTPHRDVKAATCLALADYLKMAKETTESRLIKIATAGENSLGKDKLTNVRKMQERGLDKVAAESEALFQKVIDQYADIRIETNSPQSAAELAEGELYLLRNLYIGRMAPEIEGKDIHGKAMKLSDYRGKVVVLDFGSHRSCGVCRQMYPAFRMMVENHKEQPFALLGISVEDDVKELVTLAAKGENTWPIWWDGENMEGPLATQWVIRAMPTIFVLDSKGMIRNKGFLQPTEIEATVSMLLKEMGVEEP